MKEQPRPRRNVAHFWALGMKDGAAFAVALAKVRDSWLASNHIGATNKDQVDGVLLTRELRKDLLQIFLKSAVVCHKHLQPIFLDLGERFRRVDTTLIQD